MNLLTTVFARRADRLPARSVSIRLDGACYRYDDGSVGLKPTDLLVGAEAGNVAVIGLNGAGKSTLMRLLGARTAPTAGSAVFTVDGVGLDATRRADRRRIEECVGFVDIAHVETPFRRAPSIEQALHDYLKRHRASRDGRDARIGALLERFDLTEVRHAPLSELDGERVHLLAMAVACARGPAIVVADEPTQGLDEISSAHVARRLFDCGRPVVFSTHDVDLIEQPLYGITRALVMDEAHVVFDGAPCDAAEYYTQLIRSKYQAMASRRRATASSTSATSRSNASGSASSDSAR